MPEIFDNLEDQIWEYIWVDPKRVSGVPCLRGTRMPVWSILAELGDGRSIGELAEDFELDPELLKGLMDALASAFNTKGMPVFPKPPKEFTKGKPATRDDWDKLAGAGEPKQDEYLKGILEHGDD